MKKLLAGLGLVSLALLSGGAAQANPVVTFLPSLQHVNIGDTATIDVSISGLGAEILSAYDLNFHYNGSILHWSAGGDGPVLAQLGSSPFVLNDPFSEGNLGYSASATYPDDEFLKANQADSFLLFSFQLIGQTDGATNFGLGADLDFERNFVGLNAKSLTVDIGNACVAVGTGQCEIPEPSSYGLVGLALAGAFIPGFVSRRRRTGLGLKS